MKAFLWLLHSSELNRCLLWIVVDSLVCTADNGMWCIHQQLTINKYGPIGVEIFVPIRFLSCFFHLFRFASASASPSLGGQTCHSLTWQLIKSPLKLPCLNSFTSDKIWGNDGELLSVIAWGQGAGTCYSLPAHTQREIIVQLLIWQCSFKQSVAGLNDGNKYK